MKTINTLLVANRGEIALRVMATAKAMGIRTVAVYSDADVNAGHVLFADHALRLGPGPAAESYLLGEKVIEAARQAHADAIHPGYGFLSENAEFARAVEAAGLIFVGPSPEAIEIMGDKARAKRAMMEAGVACVPGYEGEDQSDKAFISAAADIGFPIMVKAASGGGGRGMRLVKTAEDLAPALKLARSEAENAFGSGDLILEQAIHRPRHVEVQIFADAHGATIHLGERDCSIQRRHQKIIEEAPSPIVTPELRAEMGAAAVETAKAVNYCGAGTVEFLLTEDGAFFFLEMNTRLQVEHPVTEMVTGLDLVELQLRVAAGEPLGLNQDEIKFDGHAIEVRLYAEDPEADFLPSTGPIHLWQAPSGTGVRVDSGARTGGEVSPFYDPMVAKIIAHGKTREDARRRLTRALGETALIGPSSNRDFLCDVLEQEIFARGEATTAFIDEVYGDQGFSCAAPTQAQIASAAVLQYTLARRRAERRSLQVNAELREWSNLGFLVSVFKYEIDGEARELFVRTEGRSHFTVRTGEKIIAVELISCGEERARLIADGTAQDVIFFEVAGRTIHLAFARTSFSFTNLLASSALEEEEAGGGRVTAPMHGKLLELFVGEGDSIAKGDRLAILEAMKMQHEILAEIDGTVTTVAVAAEAQMAAGDLILEIEPTEGEAS